MAVLQPLYITSGKYTASTDRKILTALVDPEASGARTGGVFGPTSRMQVTGSALTINVTPGICAIPDEATPSATTPGVYLCSIDGSNEQLTIPVSTSTRTDTVYAAVSEAQFIVTNKALASNIATLTTSAAHGFLAGQTVQVVGVDDIFDGVYQILTVGTTTTFTYTRNYTGTVTSVAVFPTMQWKENLYQIASYSLTSNIVSITTSAVTTIPTENLVTIKGISSLIDGTYMTIGASAGATTGVTFAKIASNITTTSVPTSSVAKAGVPFSIRLATGTNGSATPGAVPVVAGTLTLPLARVTVSTSAITGVVDVRQFMAAAGGVRIWDSGMNPTGPTGAQGRLRFNAATGATGQRLEIFNSISGSYAPLYNHASGHHDTVATDASTSAIHHTLGTGANQAAQGNHSHTTVGGKTFFIQPSASGTPTANAVGDVWISY